ncbi:hypothetical protein KIN20_028124 [Parelaphostrongylus tenuis]|uniref:Uncharacterized protein n=1 Tax=Parelaphostrongylus tenuis TaxID=148309 RepID=A0AAD5WEJ6_PARTN|nr:hypothetical protein KIN20_028124 [Parelaphostrongylus tenuis]
MFAYPSLQSFFSVRFHATLGVACTFALLQLVLAGLVRQRVSSYNPLSWIIVSYMIISYYWNILFGLYLSRKVRTLFDEMNILETYQPRAWTMGHLFEPEPPTPCPTNNQNKDTAETDRFKALRDAHYANEYTYVQKMEAERKALESKRAIKPVSIRENCS